MSISEQYVINLPEIYRDILVAYPRYDWTRRAGYGLSYQSIYSALEGKYRLGEIKTACENMAEVRIMTIRHDIFVCPTDLGEELILAVSGKEVPVSAVPPIDPPILK